MLRNLKNDKYSLEKESNTNLVLVTIKKNNLVKIHHLTHINAQKAMLVKENNIVKIPYRHPKHINGYLRKWELLKDSGTNVIEALDNRLVGNLNNQQQINLVWIDLSTYRKLCSTLRSSYQHVSSATTSQGTMQPHYKALNTKSFQERSNVTNIILKYN